MSELTTQLKNIAALFCETSADELLVAPVGNGNINDTYRVDGSAAPFILQRLNHEVFRQPEIVMDNISRVCDYLAGRNYPMAITQPIRTLSDKALFHRDPAGNYWRSFLFLPNTYTPDTIRDASEAHTIARAYGTFAAALQDFPVASLPETIPGFHDTQQRWKQFEITQQNDPVGRVAANRDLINRMYRAKPIIDAVAGMKQGLLPVRVTHNDTKSGNVLLDQTTGQAVAVIDLDTVMPGTILSDYGDMVRTAAPNCYEDDPNTDALEVRVDILRALREGFLAGAGPMLTQAEIDNLHLGALWIVAEQALRFLNDYLAGDTYYKIKYPEHNLVRARNQLTLLEKLGEYQ